MYIADLGSENDLTDEATLLTWTNTAELKVMSTYSTSFKSFDMSLPIQNFVLQAASGPFVNQKSSLSRLR